MSDDTNSKVGGIKRTTRAASVEEVEGVEKTGAVEKVAKTGKVGKASAVRNRRVTRQLSADEREYLHQLIEEESEKLFGDSGVSEEQKKIIGDAVKLAIDAATPADEENGDSESAQGDAETEE